jgi:hypothetical protein
VFRSEYDEVIISAFANNLAESYMDKRQEQLTKDVEKGHAQMIKSGKMYA